VISMIALTLTSPCLFLQDRRGAGANHLGKLRGVPVGQPDTAMRLRATDLCGIGRTVNTVVILREVDPNDADGSVGSWRQRCLLVACGGIPEQRRVVMEPRQPGDAVNFPFAQRKRVMLAADGSGELRH